MSKRLLINIKKLNPNVVIISLIAILLVIAVVFIAINKANQTSLVKNATTAAKKYTPNPKITDLRVSDGFAIATVADPTMDHGPASVDAKIVFRLNEDSSMTLLGTGAFFTSVDLINLGIPLKTQSKLTNSSIKQVMTDFENICNGSNKDNMPGYLGFDNSFDPDGWRIDSGKMFYIEESINKYIHSKNKNLDDEQKIICINALKKDSNRIVNFEELSTNYVLYIQFITNEGEITTRKLSFLKDKNNKWTFTIDKETI